MSEEKKFKVVGSEDAIFLKPAELAEAQLEGTFLGSYEGKYGLNHKFRDEKGQIIIVNGFGMLNKKMERVEIDKLVKLEYQGLKPIVNGPMKGKDAHTVEVLVAE